MNNQPSEIWEDAEMRINSTYTIIEELPSSPKSRIVVASRYGRRMLLKCLPADCTDDMRYREALMKEFEILSSLNHDHIVKAVAMDEVPSLGLCIVMEYIEGMPLNDFVTDSTPRKVRLRLLHDTLSALAYIHSKQIVHRDLKPSNIMVTDGARVKIIDFGLSDSNSYEILKQPAGTIGYVSPEQQAGQPTDPRNDIYSIGVIMRKMQLGWMYAPIIKQCTGVLEKRPSAEGLQKALRNIGRACYGFVGTVAVTAMLSIMPFLYSTGQIPTSIQETTEKADTIHGNVITKDTAKSTMQPPTVPTLEGEEKHSAEGSSLLLGRVGGGLESGYRGMKIPRSKIIVEAKQMIDKDVVEMDRYYDTLSNYYYHDTSRDLSITQELAKINDFVHNKCHGYDFKTSMEIAEEITVYYSTYYQKWLTKLQKLAEEKEKNR